MNIIKTIKFIEFNHYPTLEEIVAKKSDAKNIQIFECEGFRYKSNDDPSTLMELVEHVILINDLKGNYIFTMIDSGSEFSYLADSVFEFCKGFYQTSKLPYAKVRLASEVIDG